MVKPKLNQSVPLALRPTIPLVLQKIKQIMKNKILPLLALSLLTLASCEKDPPPLELERFDVRWYDDDNTFNQSIGDALTFDITVNTTDNDPDDQFIREWEFSYTVNGQFAGILQGDENMRSNTLHFDGEIFIKNLTLPGPGTFKKGDAIEFRLWCIDNFGTQVQQYHRFVLEQ
jgi:hypothetical protein